MRKYILDKHTLEIINEPEMNVKTNLFRSCLAHFSHSHCCKAICAVEKMPLGISPSRIIPFTRIKSCLNYFPFSAPIGNKNLCTIVSIVQNLFLVCFDDEWARYNKTGSLWLPRRIHLECRHSTCLICSDIFPCKYLLNKKSI